jgi:hypothetical protein
VADHEYVQYTVMHSTLRFRKSPTASDHEKLFARIWINTGKYLSVFGVA